LGVIMHPVHHRLAWQKSTRIGAAATADTLGVCNPAIPGRESARRCGTDSVWTGWAPCRNGTTLGQGLRHLGAKLSDQSDKEFKIETQILV